MADIEFEASGRILAGVVSELRLECYLDGEKITPGGTITFEAVGITGDVVADGTAAVADDIVKASLTSPSVDLLTVTWSGIEIDGFDDPIDVVSTHDAVGSWLFTLGHARRFQSGKLLSATAYPTRAITDARDTISAEFERILGYPVGRRIVVEKRECGYANTVRLLQRYAGAIRLVESRIDYASEWVEVAGPYIVTASGALGLTTSSQMRGNLRVTYEAGLEPIPLDLTDAALHVLVAKLVSDGVPASAVSQNNEHGSFNFEGKDEGFYGIDAVDRVLRSMGRKTPGIA